MNTNKFQERFKFYKENFSQEELAKLLALRETEDREPVVAPSTDPNPTCPPFPVYPIYPSYPCPWEYPVTYGPNVPQNGRWEITCDYTPNIDPSTDAKN